MNSCMKTLGREDFASTLKKMRCLWLHAHEQGLAVSVQQPSTAPCSDACSIFLWDVTRESAESPGYGHDGTLAGAASG